MMMKKKILLFLLAFLPLLAHAFTGEVEIDGIKYFIKTGGQVAEVRGYTSECPSNLIIPPTVDYEGVTCNVIFIAGYAFHGCTSLTSITIPNSVTSIGVNAFLNCTSLTSVTIPNSVTSIGDNAFWYCTSLTSVTIPNSVTSIGECAFSACSSLTSITIPNSVTSIGGAAFSHCSSLTSITVENGNTVYDSRENCNAIIHTSTNELIAGCKNTTIPNSVTSIGKDAFQGCSGLTSVTIPNSVTSIGIGAFDGCTILTSVTIPNSVTSINDYAFHGCTSLTSITIPNSVTSIGECAFSACSSLTSITIPNSVTSIGFGGFKNCSSLTTITIPNSLKSISESVFRNCTSLTSITIPNSVTSISWYAFEMCTSLTSITIPNSVTSIGQYAFQGCTSFTSITIGSGIQSIGEKAFANCPDLADLYCYAVNVPTTKNDVFSGSYPQNATLHVLDESIEQYKNTYPWSQFGEIVGFNDYQLTYNVDNQLYKSYYVLCGKKITPEPEPIKEGYTFSGWSEIPETMPAHDVTVTGTFAINKYKLIYLIDGVEYKQYDVEYGASIAPEPEPTKEGYTFSGWSDIPTTMPAHDVTVTGSFTKGQYKLTYMLDGEVYKTLNYDYNDAISPEPAPVKDGYTFSGWSEIPATMPAHDVTVTGTFTINKYKITYIVDGNVVATQDVEYGSTIVPPATDSNGNAISWNSHPTTMPAYDITIYGTYATGIDAINNVECKIKYYTLDGQPIEQPRKGVNIVRMSDGTVNKVVVP